MGLFKDEWGWRLWLIVPLFIVGVPVVFGILYLAIAVPLIHVTHVDCLRLHEATGKPTKVVASGVQRDCYIQLGTEWIPAERYRGVEIED